MYYELYLDHLFLINFVMNLYLLLLLNRNCMCAAARGRLVGGAAVGAILYLLPFLCDLPLWCKLLIGFPLGAFLMLRVSFRVRSPAAFLTLFVRLLRYSFLMCGALLLTLRCLGKRGSAGTLPVLGAGALIGLGIGFFERRAKNGGMRCRASLRNGERTVAVSALIDSGNHLVEPVSGKPVSLIEKDVFYSLWGRGDVLWRAIPYHSVGRKAGVLQGYLLPELRLEQGGVEKICKEVYVAVSEEALSAEGEGTLRMIVNPSLLENG